MCFKFFLTQLHHLLQLYPRLFRTDQSESEGPSQQNTSNGWDAIIFYRTRWNITEREKLLKLGIIEFFGMLELEKAEDEAKLKEMKKHKMRR